MNFTSGRAAASPAAAAGARARRPTYVHVADDEELSDVDASDAARVLAERRRRIVQQALTRAASSSSAVADDERAYRSTRSNLTRFVPVEERARATRDAAVDKAIATRARNAQLRQASARNEFVERAEAAARQAGVAGSAARSRGSSTNYSFDTTRPSLQQLIAQTFVVPGQRM